MNCDGCGMCCLNQPMPPILPKITCPDSPDEDRIPPEIVELLRAYVFGPLYRETDPCLWLDRLTGNCMHYEWRPDVCRDYELGGESCRVEREEAGLVQLEVTGCAINA